MMKTFEYGDQEIGQSEIVVTVASVIIGYGVLAMPRDLAKATSEADGLISIFAAGLITLFAAWMAAKLSARFPQHSFFEYTSKIATKPVAYCLSALVALYSILFASYEMRGVANIAKQYLFDRTPIEVIALYFLLVVIYGVSGSRVAIIRLNALFMPIVFGVAVLLLFLNIPSFKLEHIKPFLTTNFSGYLSGMKTTIFSFLGFEVLLFYVSLMNRPQKAPIGAIIGTSIPLLYYLVSYFFIIGVFGDATTTNILYPGVEIAKEIEVPGGFFERFESLFFTIWIMTLFNTTIMVVDISVICLQVLFKNKKKQGIIFGLAPIIYLCGMFTETIDQFAKFGDLVSYFGLVIEFFFPTLLFLIAKIRRVKGSV
jgi:spore germination protein